ncbi:hypothetical protein D3C71_1416750 [compost metagenome]
MAAGDSVTGEDMLLTDLEYGYPALVKLKIDNIAYHLVGRQGSYLIVAVLRHLLHAFSQFGNAQLHPVQPNRLNTDLQLPG